MAIAWVIRSERTLLILFPEVIFFDAVKDTNKEGRPLLMIIVKGTNRRVFTILLIFIANEQSWIFRLVFSVILPRMFNKAILVRVEIIFSNGDSQETNQIENALRIFLPNVYRGRCGWYIVDIGW